MRTAQQGDKVRVHYKGTLNDGTVFDDSSEREPLEFTLGENQIIPGFESAVTGMEIGENKAVAVDPDEAYGQTRDELFIEVPKEEITAQLEPELGMVLEVTLNDGNKAHVTVSEIGEEKVVLDANHPLAGKTLNFDLTLQEIVE
ncbi:FKBP-type peptidyl-prolyl cis-trans isomerase [Desulfohalobium retbaense]|uniref:Peptidyl-prolyl cis-trans isomerase n=1 Tax=Desulfohalobium retbaense (strain ATCC 49708 / DSM 5692 / JCM 16813 / HR100) TaxID=485915 RepID=C8X0A6_DESRD|nr:peptidylprolyl isomerase [Desulfohalobium retbaense]ACV67731.1 peptidylprolyl isomerase FKBP-type [Desulfohalobium retbaense DSM 5692]